jgi:KDO2-lipid IV(A) lauroyltransferase
VLTFYIFKVASRLSFHSPGWLRLVIANLAGDIYYWAVRNHSRKSDESIRIVLGEAVINRRVRQVSRQCFRNYAKYMLEFLRLPHVDLLEGREVPSCGWDLVDASLERGKGTILITSHFGNWDIAALLATSRGYKMSALANDFKPPQLNELIQGARRRMGLVIYSPKDALRGLYSSLKNNGMVVLLLDSPLQHAESDYIAVDFFGKLARFPVGPARLAHRTGAQIMFGYVARQPGDKHYYGMWEPPLTYEVTGDRDEDVKAITQACARELETLIRRHPDQWYMFRKLWLDEEEYALHLVEQERNKERKMARTNKIRAN